MKKLYYFTNSYPYDIGEQWKTNELKVLKETFRITVIPFYSNSNNLATSKINGINYQEPLFEELPKNSIKTQLLTILFCKYIFVFLQEFFNKTVYKNKTKFIQWITASFKMLILSKNQKLQKILNNADKKTIFYFFWGKETSEIIPILSTKAKIIVRYHGYDLYEERSYGYVPYRKKQLQKINTALFVSEQGLNYIKKRYKKVEINTELIRLGTTEYGKSKMSADNVLRIFSCSSVIPLKRVDLIAKAVLQLNFKVEWTHIGGGEYLDNIKQICKKTKSNIIINLVGNVKQNEVKNFYINNYADIFINASTTEGVPVSIMEAMSAEIPVLATNVGGTSEIVSEKTGKLLPVNITDKDLAKEITVFFNLTQDEKVVMRKNAYKTFVNKYNAKTNATVLSNYFIQLCSQ